MFDWDRLCIFHLRYPSSSSSSFASTFQNRTLMAAQPHTSLKSATSGPRSRTAASLPTALRTVPPSVPESSRRLQKLIGTRCALPYCKRSCRGVLMSGWVGRVGSSQHQCSVHHYLAGLPVRFLAKVIVFLGFRCRFFSIPAFFASFRRFSVFLLEDEGLLCAVSTSMVVSEVVVSQRRLDASFA